VHASTSVRWEELCYQRAIAGLGEDGEDEEGGQDAEDPPIWGYKRKHAHLWMTPIVDPDVQARLEDHGDGPRNGQDGRWLRVREECSRF
jgi:hypothetical protein